MIELIDTLRNYIFDYYTTKMYMCRRMALKEEYNKRRIEFLSKYIKEKTKERSRKEIKKKDEWK